MRHFSAVEKGAPHNYKKGSEDPGYRHLRTLMPSVADKTTPSKADFPVEPYARPPKTSAILDYAPLVEIDVSKFDEPGEKQRLAAQLEDAVRNVGFWIVTGHGIKDAEVLRILSIANAFFKRPKEEKTLVKIDLGKDKNFGYREPTRTYGDSGVKETLETYEIHKSIPVFKDTEINPMIKAYWDEIAPFHRKLYDNVLSKLYILLAILLELPEDTFLEMTAYDNPSEDRIRTMLHHARPRHEHDLVQKHGIGAHNDFGFLTLLVILLSYLYCHANIL